ncbi:MAG: hypothetical protein ACRCWQ_11005 [Bacilli bacterium]
MGHIKNKNFKEPESTEYFTVIKEADWKIERYKGDKIYYRSKVYECICKICGRHCDLTKERIEKGKYCSQECRNMHRPKNKVLDGKTLEEVASEIGVTANALRIRLKKHEDITKCLFPKIGRGKYDRKKVNSK